MNFHEIRFPANLSFGSVGGPERRTEVVTLANGFEERNTPWAHSRRRYDAGLGMRSLDDIETLIAFLRGAARAVARLPLEGLVGLQELRALARAGFPRLRDRAGDGQTRDFPIVKLYRSGDQLCAPDRQAGRGQRAGRGRWQRLVAGAHFEADATTGTITFTDAPAPGAEVSAGFEFDVPVRFDTDSIQTSVASFKAGDAPSVPVVEIRV